MTYIDKRLLYQLTEFLGKQKAFPKYWEISKKAGYVMSHLLTSFATNNHALPKIDWDSYNTPQILVNSLR